MSIYFTKMVGHHYFGFFLRHNLLACTRRYKSKFVATVGAKVSEDTLSKTTFGNYIPFLNKVN